MTTDISVVRGGWDPTLQQEIVDEYEYDGGNSSSRLFERSRIKALAGTSSFPYLLSLYSLTKNEMFLFDKWFPMFVVWSIFIHEFLKNVNVIEKYVWCIAALFRKFVWYIIRNL